MEALNALLKAQAQVKERQITRQASGQGGPGNNNRNYDVSTLFDKELQRAQQSSYETKNSAEAQPASGGDALDKIKDLARRQDELLKRQQTLARDRDKMTAEEIKRQLEQLTREQSELRQRAEELANSQQSSSQQSDSQQSSSQQSSSQQSKSQQATGQQSGRSGTEQRGAAMRCAASRRRCAMRRASCAGRIQRRPARAGAAPSTSCTRSNGRCRAAAARAALTRSDASSATCSSRRGSWRTPSVRSASELDKLEKRRVRAAAGSSGDSKADATRRLAGEQERLADRTKALQEGLKRQAGAGAASSEIQRQRVAERMQQSADAMRGGQIRRRSVDGHEQERAGNGTRARQGGRHDGVRRRARPMRRASCRNSSRARSSCAIGSTAPAVRWKSSASRADPATGASAEKTPGETGRSGQGQNGNGEGGGSRAAARGVRASAQGDAGSARSKCSATIRRSRAAAPASPTKGRA